MTVVGPNQPKLDSANTANHSATPLTQDYPENSAQRVFKRPTLRGRPWSLNQGQGRAALDLFHGEG